MKNSDSDNLSTVYLAGGCFWGVEYMMQQLSGVTDVVSGYMGGITDFPRYEEVKTGLTGHAEVVRVTFDPTVTDYETVAKLFFEIHDPTQTDGQGSDLGDQYRSEIFYTSEEQRQIAEKLICILREKGVDVVTRLTFASTFWEAEDYHQNYYEQKGSKPYCHSYRKLF